MRFLLILLVALGGMLQAQDVEPSKWTLDVLTGFGKFNLAGEYSIFEAPASGGIQYDAGFAQVGAFLTIAASGGSEDTEDAADLGAMIHVNFLEKSEDNEIVKRIGVGAGVDWWRTSKGLRFDEGLSEIFFFSITFDL